MNGITTYLFKMHYTEESKWLKKAMVVYALYKCLYWLMNFSVLFSADNIIYHNDVQLSWWENAVFVLFNHPSPLCSGIFISLTFVTALYILYGSKFHRLTFFLLWFLVSNINNNVFCTMTGGDVLFQHLLFFCIFLSNGRSKQDLVMSDLDTAFHNTGIIALHIQVCLVYFLNGLAKLLDVDWANGNALSDSLAIHEFSLPLFYESKGTFTATLNCLVVWYQLLFPALVYFKKIKKWYLLLGVAQQLFIIFILGLPSFGIIMIAAYAIFYSPFKKT